MPFTRLAATEAWLAGKVPDDRTDNNGEERFDDLPRIALNVAAADVGAVLEAGRLTLKRRLGDPGVAAAAVVGLGALPFVTRQLRIPAILGH